MFQFINFLCLSLLVTAPVLSVPFQQRDVVVPPVTSPNSSSVWAMGTTQTVVWDTSGLPRSNQITKTPCEVILGRRLSGGNLDLMLGQPLAQGFNITQGSVKVVIPIVPHSTNYLVILIMGDSGNVSPTFAITVGPSSSATPRPTSSSSTRTSSSFIRTPAPSRTVAPSTSTVVVIDTVTSSTTVVVQPTGTGTEINGAMPMRSFGARSLSVALIISGILL